ncbi:ExbD/TolR family protein [Allosediminivita pacifica]|nr:biopolymer transporter ExbD [Allosediminivita pacifica]
MRSTRRRRKLSMTSLIDVIFLLLLFFMLTSTFTRFAELDLAAASGGGGASETRPVFLRLATERLSLNGRDLTVEELPERLGEQVGEEGVPVLVSLNGEVTAQRLTDVLAALRGVEGLRVTVLGGS